MHSPERAEHLANQLVPDAGTLRAQLLRDSSLRAHIDSFDWAKTPLGPVSGWPGAVRTTVRLMLASRVPMVALIGEHGILIYNDAYAVFAGARHPALLGKPVTEAWPEIADFNREVMRRVYHGGESFTLNNQLLSLTRKHEPENVWLDLDYSPVVDDGGTTLAVLAIVNEITKRVEVEDALERKREELSFALEAAGIVGTWNWRIPENLIIADRLFAELYGVDPAEAARGAPIERFIEGVHPEDRALLGERIASAIRDLTSFRAEYRLQDKAGNIRWALAVGRAFPDENGRPSRLPGVTIDITDRKTIETALAESEARFRAIADTMPQMVWSTTPDGLHDYYNARWYEFTGVPVGSTDGEGWNDMFHPDDREIAWAAWQRCLQTGEEYEIEYRLRHHSGQYRWTLGRALAIRDADGTIMRWFGTCTDIHEAKLVTVEREVVAQELSHRIKNIFSVLSGLVALSGRRHPELAPVVDELRQRIAALGRAHDFVRPHSSLSRPHATDTTLHALIGALLSPYTHEDGRLVLTGDDVAIDDRPATPLALLFHELATNAAKYGAFSTASGTVTVHTQMDAEGCTILWRERGSPAHSGPVVEGFGSRLIALSVDAQMGGKAERHWHPDGLEMRVSIPNRSLSRSEPTG